MFTGSHVSFYCNFYFISIAILCIYPDVAGAFLLRCYLSVLINGCNLPIGRCITEGCCMLIGKHLLFGIYKDNRCLNLICLSYLNRCLSSSLLPFRSYQRLQSSYRKMHNGRLLHAYRKASSFGNLQGQQMP